MRRGNVKFTGKRHEELFLELLRKMDNYDCYHTAFAYLVTLDIVCRNHIGDIYDFKGCCLKDRPLRHAWQTETSRKTTRLACNLYTGSTVWCEEGEERYCSVDEIFCCAYAPYFYEAIKLRYPEYTKEA